MKTDRTSYVFLTVLSVVCTVMGLVFSRMEAELDRVRTEDARRSLLLCADALQNGDTFRFQCALNGLEINAGVRRHLLERGDSCLLLKDAFTALAAEFPGTDTHADEAIRRLEKALLREAAARPSLSPPLEPSAPENPIAEELAHDNALLQAGQLLGDAAGAIKLKKEPPVLVLEAVNARADFSAADGSLLRFWYLRGRLPDPPSTDDDAPQGEPMHGLIRTEEDGAVSVYDSTGRLWFRQIFPGEVKR